MHTQLRGPDQAEGRKGFLEKVPPALTVRGRLETTKQRTRIGSHTEGRRPWHVVWAVQSRGWDGKRPRRPC